MFNGNCEEALKFYAITIGGEIKNLSRFEGSPAEHLNTDQQKVLHANFEGSGIAFMASDGTMESVNNIGNIHLCIDFKDSLAMENVFIAMSENGKITMPLEDTFGGAKFGMLTDQFGINWMFNCDKKED